MYEVNVKGLFLLFCSGFIFLSGSIFTAVATPIHDAEDGGIALDGTRSACDNGRLYGVPASDCFVRFPSQSEVGASHFKSFVSAFENAKNTRHANNQHRDDDAKTNREVHNPAPATLFLLGTGLIGLAAFRRKRPVRS